MASGKYLFTSESVSMGHPDKLADQISDGVVDALLAQDPTSRIACETMVTTGLAIIAGEITTTADDVAFNGAVSLTGAVAMDTAVGIGDITFSSTVDGGQPLSLTAGSGNVVIPSAVGGGTRLGALTIASAANVAGDAGATADTGTITAATVTQTAGTGTSRFAQIDTNAAGGVDLNGAAFALNGGVTTTAGGALTVTNSGTLTIADTTGPADTATVDIDLDGAFTQDGAGGGSMRGGARG